MECEEPGCSETPVWVVELEVSTWVCDDHKGIFPEELVTRVE